MTPATERLAHLRDVYKDRTALYCPEDSTIIELLDHIGILETQLAVIRSTRWRPSDTIPKVWCGNCGTLVFGSTEETT